MSISGENEPLSLCGCERPNGDAIPSFENSVRGAPLALFRRSLSWQCKDGHWVESRLSDRLEVFRYLWAEPKGDWVLVRSESSADEFAIFNTQGAVKRVEDAEVHAAICERMLAAGCRVLDALPMLGATAAKPSGSNDG